MKIYYINRKQNIIKWIKKTWKIRLHRNNKASLINQRNSLIKNKVSYSRKSLNGTWALNKNLIAVDWFKIINWSLGQRSKDLLETILHLKIRTYTQQSQWRTHTSLVSLRLNLLPSDVQIMQMQEVLVNTYSTKILRLLRDLREIGSGNQMTESQKYRSRFKLHVINNDWRI